MEATQSFIRVKPTVFGQLFTVNQDSKPRIQWNIESSAVTAMGPVWGATTEACANLFWTTLNLLITENSLNFNHKTNDVSVSKIDHKFSTKLLCCWWR